jgi:HK97 gp10 family phage protein
LSDRYVKTSLKITGLQDLLKQLEELPDDLEAKAVKSGLRKALQFLVEKVKATILSNGSYLSGRLYKSIVASSLKRGYKGRKTVTSQVYAKKVPYAHLIELGYKHTGGKHIPAKSFLLKTAEGEAQSVVDKFEEELKGITERALKRYHKKYGRG